MNFGDFHKKVFDERNVHLLQYSISSQVLPTVTYPLLLRLRLHLLLRLDLLQLRSRKWLEETQLSESQKKLVLDFSSELVKSMMKNAEVRRKHSGSL